MKKIAVFVVLCWFAIACSKNSQNASVLTGKWQLSEIFLQTIGTGSWYPEDSIPPNYIQFNSDGSLTVSPYVSYLYNSPLSYRVTTDTSMIFKYANGLNTLNENTFYYHLTDTGLMIYPPAFERVIEKFIRVP